MELVVDSKKDVIKDMMGHLRTVFILSIPTNAGSISCSAVPQPPKWGRYISESWHTENFHVYTQQVLCLRSAF